MNTEKRERLPVSVSAAVLIEDEEGRLLLLKQEARWKGDKWGPPGGGLHPHEDPITTALRETREEIGVEIELVDLIGIYTVDRGDSATGIGFVFRGKIKSGKIKPHRGEIKDFRFSTPAEIQEMVENDLIYKPEYNLQIIKDWLENKSFPIEVIRPIS